MIKVVSVDDHPVINNALQQQIQNQDDMIFLGSATNGESGYQLILNHKPDIAILDASMPGVMNGIELTKKLVEHQMQIKVVIYSSYSRPRYVMNTLAAGARGYILKSEPFDAVTNMIRKVFKSDRWWLSSEIQEIVYNENTRHESEKLTPREEELLKWVAQGYNTVNISNLLGLKENTIKNHLKSIYKKLKVSDRVNATLEALRMGIISLDE